MLQHTIKGHKSYLGTKITETWWRRALWSAPETWLQVFHGKHHLYSFQKNENGISSSPKLDGIQQLGCKIREQPVQEGRTGLVPVCSAMGLTRTLISTCGEGHEVRTHFSPKQNTLLTWASLSHSLSVLKAPLIDPRAQSSFLSSNIQKEREFGRKLVLVLCKRNISACLNLINKQDYFIFFLFWQNIANEA